MNGFLIDTNVVSEFSKPIPDHNVMKWFSLAEPNHLFTSAITVGELRAGIESLPLGRRRNILEQWLNVGLPEWFAPNILPVTPAISDQWGRFSIVAKKNGTPISVPDCIIAATAAEHRLTLVTRNVTDFACLEISILNPWTP